MIIMETLQETSLICLIVQVGPSFKGLSQIAPGARTASKNCYLSHIILLTVRDPELICESPFTLSVSEIGQLIGLAL